MIMDKDGKIELMSRRSFRVMEEFGFNLEEMSDTILDLRDELEKVQKELEIAKDAINDR